VNIKRRARPESTAGCEALEFPRFDKCMGMAASLSLADAQAAKAADAKGSEAKVSTKVVLRLFISATGSIEGVKVDPSSGDARLDDAAVKGTTGKTREPATANGRRIASCTTFSIVFHLNR
jgi:TonB family protein